jgi:hypothetical protein
MKNRFLAFIGALLPILARLIGDLHHLTIKPAAPGTFKAGRAVIASLRSLPE